AEWIARHEDVLRAKNRCDDEIEVQGLPDTDWAAFRDGGRILVLLMSFRAKPMEITVSRGTARTTTTVLAYGTEVVFLEK
ncbi:MAG: hypothetical protein KAI66_14005, partial [Lentisphaeria bacterium]|nr:hypothetical protein [Lentisphaeria bacterium]